MPGLRWWSGKGATVQLSLNDESIELDVISWRIKRYGEKVDDNVCGELRSRKSFEIDGYEVTIKFASGKLEAVERFLDEQANLDQSALSFEGWMGILIKPNDGTQLALMGQNMCIDDWDFGVEGRKQRNDGNLPLRFDDIKGLPTMGS